MQLLKKYFKKLFYFLALLSSTSEPKFMLTRTGKVVPVNPEISSVLTMDDLIELKVNQQGMRFNV